MSPAIQRRMAIVLPVLLVTAGWWLLAWRPASAEQATSLDRREAAEQEELRIAAQVRSAARFRDGGRRSDDELAAARDALPEDVDLAGLLRLHDELAARVGVSVESFAPAGTNARKDPSTPSGLDDTAVAITVSGSASAATEYLRGLRELRRFVVVDHVTQSTSGGDVRLDLDIRGFHRRRGGLLGS